MNGNIYVCLFSFIYAIQTIDIELIIYEGLA